MYNYIKKLSLVFLLLVSVNTSRADDIDIINIDPYGVDTNILFIMDVSGSMEWDDKGFVPLDPSQSRLSILKNAMATLLTDPDMVDINVGLSSFAGNTSVDSYSQTAHGISYPVSDIDADAETILDQNPEFDHPGTSFLPPTGGVTTRGYLQTISNTWTPYGGTPIVDALFEGALYFRGLPTNWGRHDPSKIRAAHPSTYIGLLKDVTTTTTAYQCNNESCSGASCNATMSCSTSASIQTCSTASCGDTCTAITGRQACAAGDTTCGNGANCSTQTTTYTRDCITNSELLCRIVHPTWYGCNTVSDTSCTTSCPDSQYDEFGVCLNPVQDCNVSEHKQCKEDVTSTICDSDLFQCSTDVEYCQHEVCGNVTTNVTELTGTADFVSPIKNECPANGIILLSDGIPSTNLSANLVSDMIGPTYNNNCDTGTDAGRCGAELATYLATEDNSSTIDGVQGVRTFTIGMALDGNQAAEDYLKSIAKAGDGAYVSASSSESLVGAFKSAIASIADAKARTFSSSSYSINTSTQLTHGDSVFVPIFDRSATTVWSGNLKKYEIKDGELYGLDDSNVKVKATETDGTLKSDVRDLWATTASTDAVKSGGVANKIDPINRKVFTDNGSALVGLSSASNAQYGATDDAEKLKLINFIKGLNDDGTSRNHMGDIIHSKPIQLSYKSGGTEKVAIFVGTNEGYLHAIDGDTGEELFAFMPEELLKNIKPQYKQAYSKNHIYGVDGSTTIWVDETSSVKPNGLFDEASEKVYLYFGLRRGGKSYYALDVTNPGSPVLKWKISDATTNFSDLGFTWSEPTVAHLKYKKGGNVTPHPEPVLVFGGGYVDDHSGEALNSGRGANVYIINAKDGSHVFDVNTDATKFAPAGSKLKYAIPGDIRVIDVDRNGSIDRLYFGDTNANIWRVDLNADKSDPYNQKKAQLTQLATLGGADADNRKFFNEPDVAIFKHKQKYVISVSIGSGERPNPLDQNVNDYFFMLLDENIFKVPPVSGFTPITLAKLLDAPITDGTDLISKLNEVNSKKGWKLSLDSSLNGLLGEKVLSSALTFQNKVLFTSFGVKSVTSNVVNAVTCSVENKNSARFYALNLLNGKAVLDLSNDNVVDDKSDSSVPVSSGEILGTPQVIYTEDGTCTKDDCSRTFDIHVGKKTPVATHKTKDANPPPINSSVPRVYWIDREQ